MNSENNNKKKLLMKSAVAFTFALTMFAANAGGEAFAEEAMSAAMGTGVNVNQEDADADEDVADGDSADNGDGTRDVTTNYDAAEEDTDEGSAPVTEDEAVSEDTEEAEEAEAADTEEAEEAADEDAAEESDEAVIAVQSESKTLLGGADNYNVFVRGDYTVDGADISSNGNLGNIAAGGNVSIPDNYTAGKAVVGGELSGSFLNGTSDEAVDFNGTFAHLEAASNAMANMEANGSISANRYWGEINFNGSDADLNVFTITVDEFNAMRAQYPDQLSISFNVPAGSSCVVNIIGEGEVDLSVNAGAFYAKEAVSNGTSNNGNIMFNVPNASKVTIKDNMGSLMAVNADVTSAAGSNNSHFEGSLICNSFTGSTEFGSTSFDPSKISDKLTPETPEENEDETPDTPVETPEENEDETPDTPVETPEENEDETPDTPVETPEENEDETPDTPVETPEENEDETPDTPVETPEENEDETPDTPVETPEENEDETPDTPVETPEENEDETPDTPVETPEENEDETPDTPVETPEEDETPDTPVETPEENEDETPDTPVETPEENEDETPDTPVETPEENEDETPDTPVETPEENEDETPDTPVETPEENEDKTPDVPVVPSKPITPPVDAYNPYEVIETFDDDNEPEVPVTPEIVEFEETAVPLGDTPIEEEVVEDSDDDGIFETFDDAPVPLADDPFADSETTNPKTGEDMTIPAVSAAAAMASFLAIMYANRKKREER